MKSWPERGTDLNTTTGLSDNNQALVLILNYKYLLLARRLTCEILPKVLLQFNCLVKDFIGLLICLPLVHFPGKKKKIGQLWLV